MSGAVPPADDNGAGERRRLVGPGEQELAAIRQRFQQEALLNPQGGNPTAMLFTVLELIVRRVDAVEILLADATGRLTINEPPPAPPTPKGSG